ncbi:MAG: chemotaxis protein CheW [Planctomycetes bacterium]|nr:chemotaxis protein CheW [Planctomycetota bacterium]
MADRDEFIKEFLVECREGLDQLDSDLVSLEVNPRDTVRLDRIFRTLHTIKGSSGFLGFDVLGELAHAGETLLGRMRSGELVLNEAITDSLLQLLDAIRGVLKPIQETGREATTDHRNLLDLLQLLAVSSEDVSDPKLSSQTARLNETLSVDEVAPKASQHNLEVDYSETQSLDSRLAVTGEYDSSLIQESDSVSSTPSTPDSSQAVTPQPEADATAKPSKLRASRDSSRLGAPSSIIRVDVSLLDQLMNLVGELVLARNRIVQITSLRDVPELAQTTQQLNQLTTELQEGIMKTRMQQIGSVWQKYPRLVRDVARRCEKKVMLKIEGAETELDKTLLEALADPLVHLVRNAIDHGIEMPLDRLEQGKSEQGQLSLRAYHQGGHVNVEIEDDGAGLNVESIKRKAVDRGLLTIDQVARLSHQEILRIIFAPGFSTADEITSLSGRGVGMDVVRTNIEHIGGTVDIESYPQQGTTIRIRVPLTLAIIPAMIIHDRQQRYAIPQVNVTELLSLEGDEPNRMIERFHNTPVLRLRGELLPLAWLSEILDTGERSVPAGEDTETNILILQAGTRRLAIIVDEISNTEEIVVKPMSGMLETVSAYAGATIMGNGEVALILDALGLARRVGLFSQLKERDVPTSLTQSGEVSAERPLLVCEVGDRRVGIALPEVTRLEQVSPLAIERSGSSEVMQCRSGLLTLVRLRDVFGEPVDSSERVQLPVVVHTEERGSVGFIVDRVLDIVEQPSEMEHSANQHNVSGVAVIHGHVTDVLDLPGLIRTAAPTFFGAATTPD